MPIKTIRIGNEKIYNQFQQIKSRCSNKNHRRYKDYGGRGINCEWKRFEDFYNDMKLGYKAGLQIDRIDNNKSYYKENCRWVNASENSKNRRNTIFIEGICLKDYCAKNNLKYCTIRNRIIKLKWDIKKAIYT